ncbi:MAG TPA: flavodoxin domain-containing protein [Polyangiaceae bacterium]|nr:flavodoxin domain-containing protein [Polyangiaceae bacterium]
MKPILIVYATREGHTRLIAQHIAELLRRRAYAVELYDARDTESRPRVGSYSGALLAASLHLGKHEKEMQRFIERERSVLSTLPTLFLSVSLSAAGAQDTTRALGHRQRVLGELKKCTDALFDQTGWRPGHTEFVAGALMYTQYNPLIRWVMKRIARQEGASVDTTHDHIYTDYQALDRSVEAFVQSLEPELRAAG